MHTALRAFVRGELTRHALKLPHGNALRLHSLACEADVLVLFGGTSAISFNGVILHNSLLMVKEHTEKQLPACTNVVASIPIRSSSPCVPILAHQSPVVV